jgi:hypothetical protein
MFTEDVSVWVSNVLTKYQYIEKRCIGTSTRNNNTNLRSNYPNFGTNASILVEHFACQPFSVTTRLDTTGGERTVASDVNLSDLDLILQAVDAHLQSKGLKVKFCGECTSLLDKIVKPPTLIYECDDFKLRILTDGDILECAKWDNSNRDDYHEEYRFSIHDP